MCAAMACTWPQMSRARHRYLGLQAISFGVVAATYVLIGVQLANSAPAAFESQQAQLKFLTEPSKVDINRVIASAKVDGEHLDSVHTPAGPSVSVSCRW